MKIFCIGRNYSEHTKELNNETPESPVVFMKPATALLKDNQPFFYPEWTKDLHYETELVLRVCKQGKYIKDWEGDYSTTTIGDKECAYAIYDENKILKCGIEQAYLDGKISWKKPISCHLYPIRITKYESYHALNYDRWSICSDACSLGEKLGVPVYKFLKEPLIRAYGEAWYAELEKEINTKISNE